VAFEEDWAGPVLRMVGWPMVLWLGFCAGAGVDAGCLCCVTLLLGVLNCSVNERAEVDFCVKAYCFVEGVDECGFVVGAFEINARGDVVDAAEHETAVDDLWSYFVGELGVTVFAEMA